MRRGQGNGHDFLDARGRPAALPVAGKGATFTELIRRFSGDVPVRAFIDNRRKHFFTEYFPWQNIVEVTLPILARAVTSRVQEVCPVVTLGDSWEGYLAGLVGKEQRIRIAKTLELALNLHPQSRRIIMISGSDAWSRSIQKVSMDVAQPYKHRLQFTWLSDTTMEALIETVSQPLDDAIVFVLLFVKDKSGEIFIPQDACRIIAKASTAPVYTIWSDTIGTGVVGGNMLSEEDMAKGIADVALRILKGEKPADIPIERYDSSYLFDWRQLKRWSIKESQLPQGSKLVFK